MEVTNLKEELYKTMHDSYARFNQNEEEIQKSIEDFIGLMKHGFLGYQIKSE